MSTPEMGTMIASEVAAMPLPEQTMSVGERLWAPIDRFTEGIKGRWNKVTATVGLVAVLSSGAMALETQTAVAANRDVNVERVCDNGEFDNVAGNTSFSQEAFLPKADELKNKDDAVKYVNKLFNKGPLGKKIDPMSLAALMSAAGTPSHDGVTTNPNYNYVPEAVTKALSYQSSEGGLEAARKDCKEIYETLSQSISFSRNWVEKRGVVTKFVAKRDNRKDNEPSHRYDITGFELEKRTTNKNLDVILVKLPKAKGNLDDFTEFGIDRNGDIYFKGVTVGEGQGANVKEVAAALREQAEAADKAEQGTTGAQVNQQGGGGQGQPGGGPGGCQGVGEGCPGGGPGGPGGGGAPSPELEPTLPPTTTTTTRPPTTTTTTLPKGVEPPPPPPPEEY